ncbi:MAG: hypothetical protein ABSD88_11505 [Candidatus Korobacteraceae bacterium]|jgi:hypothetical protein
MKKWLCSVAGLFLALAGSLAAYAQTPAVPPPNILNIETVTIKPYENGHYDKVVSEYPALSRQFKDPTHFLAMEALTGSPRAIYLSGYDSYEALQKNEEWLLGNAAIDAKVESLEARVAPYISEVNHTIWHYRPDLSNNVAGADIPHSRYWEVIIFHMRSGHGDQFGELTKIYRDANLKIGQNIPWATYEGLMSVTEAYLVLVPMTSLKDRDTGLAHKKDFGAALGDEGRDRMNKLSERSVASVEDNIWMVNPDWSYVEKSWIEADPQFWGLDPAAKSASRPVAGGGRAPKAPPVH